MQSKLRAEDGHQIPLYTWAPESLQECDSTASNTTADPQAKENESRGVIQIAHGLSEHGHRYHSVAQYLNKKGYTVVAHDHRGHGLASRRRPGFFAETDGWQKITDDLHQVSQHCATLAGHKPHFLLAHSMGSFVALNMLQRHPFQFTGTILSGSNCDSPLKFLAAEKLARLERLRIGPKRISDFLHQLSFGNFNQSFHPASSEHSWLSRDPEQVRRYDTDPFCGARPTTQLWTDFLGGLSACMKQRAFKQIAAQPFYLLAGSHDPVGQFGKGVEKLGKRLHTAGIRSLKIRLYDKGRHEMLNESNREEVLEDMLSWIQNTVGHPLPKEKMQR